MKKEMSCIALERLLYDLKQSGWLVTGSLSIRFEWKIVVEMRTAFQRLCIIIILKACFWF